MLWRHTNNSRGSGVWGNLANGNYRVASYQICAHMCKLSHQRVINNSAIDISVYICKRKHYR